MLVRLVYASRAVDDIDDALIKSIVDASLAHNKEHGITGVLCTQPGQNVFVQVLEGSRVEVNALYGNIVRDDRNRDVTLLYYEEIDERRFAGWRMGAVDLKRVNVSTILRFSERPVLDPFTITGKGVLSLIDELVATAAIVSRSEH